MFYEILYRMIMFSYSLHVFFVFVLLLPISTLSSSPGDSTKTTMPVL